MLRGAKRRGNPFPARHRRADGTSGTPSPTERFDARQTKAPAINGGGLRAGRPTRNPAAVRPLMRAGRGSESHPARGIPKRKTTQRVVFLYFSRSAQQNRRGSNSASRHPTNGRAIRRSPAFTSGFDALRAGRGSEFHPARGIPKRKTTQRVVFLFGAGDEARTRYLDLGKVALYQMSYARKRKIDYTSHRSVCQPRFSNFRKISCPPLRAGMPAFIA